MIGREEKAVPIVHPWGVVAGKDVQLVSFGSSFLRASVSTYGAIVKSVEVMSNGEWVPVALGYDTLEQYVADDAYIGATVGRYANRIANGSFVLDEVAYSTLSKNDLGKHSLHGGAVGFNRAVWSFDLIMKEDAVGVTLHHLSPDGDEGFPCALAADVSYFIPTQKPFTLQMEVVAKLADPNETRRTVCNIVNHNYWNLAGSWAANTAQEHLLKVDAELYTVVDKESIPTGEIASVEGTPLDFRVEKSIGRDIDNSSFFGGDGSKLGFGYDHNFVLKGNREVSSSLRHPKTGIEMSIATTLPGLQLYTGNYLKGKEGAHGKRISHRGAVCLEAQFFPDSPNKLHFPQPTVGPGEKWQHTVAFTFNISQTASLKSKF